MLNRYSKNLQQSSRKTRDAIRFQRFARENSQAISQKLSCWVMKFNDVLNSVSSKPNIFDCIIVDEASQLNFNSLLLGYYTKNIIIVGDEKQTAPSHLTGAEGKSFDTIKNKFLTYMNEGDKAFIRSDISLFDLSSLVAGGANISLKEHFRCVPEIIAFSNQQFYDNKLRPLKQINSNRPQPKLTVFVKNAYAEKQIVKKEIQQIQEYLKKLIEDKRYENKTIGVVSLGLAKHTEALKAIMQDFDPRIIEKYKLVIEDATKFQGDERDVMLVSLGVALDYEKLQNNENATPRAIINDMVEKRKINVALSRAKEQMILFHSIQQEDLGDNDFRNDIIKFFYEEFKEIETLSIPNIDVERNRYNVPKPFDSWFEIDVAQYLIERGFSKIQPQFKVKEKEEFHNPHTGQVQGYVNFKLDLVVHNNGKRVAIECDGDPYHTLPEDVAYDIERQEFLERVGWKVYRILYSAFKRNPTEEIDKMIAFIERNTKKEEVNQLNNMEQNYEEDIEEDQFYEEEVQETESILTTKHKSYIDILEEEIAPNLFDNKEIKKENNEKIEESLNEKKLDDENKVIAYFNLSDNGQYRIEHFADENCKWYKPIKKKHENGFLLQCYDNGCVNKIKVRSLLSKKRNRLYSNGKNNKANLLYLKFVEKEELLSITIKRNGHSFFKAHKTEGISTHQDLHPKGNKLVSENYTEIKYKILPIEIYNDISRLVFSSFTAQAKNISQKHYQQERNFIKKFIVD